MVKRGKLPHMMKSVRIASNLYASAEREADYMHRSTAGQLEYWANLGRKAEALLDKATLLELIYIEIVDDAQAISTKNNERIASQIKSGKLSAESVRFFDKDMVKKSKVKLAGTGF